ncbi:MAG: DUF2059 domain-containing protein [Pseudomonadota bacterium]
MKFFSKPARSTSARPTSARSSSARSGAARFLAIALIAAASMTMWQPTAFAQELSASHMAAARKALAATRATAPFDRILIQAATALKNRLTATNPDQAAKIAETVDNEAIALAARRADLENEAARAFGNSFSEDELTQIANFFAGPVGQKYLDSTTVIGRQLGQAANVWGRGIQRDLTQNVTKKLSESQ